jgi:hypothetical protein
VWRFTLRNPFCSAGSWVLGIIPSRHGAEKFLRCDTEELFIEHNSICITLETIDRNPKTLLLISQICYYILRLFSLFCNPYCANLESTEVRVISPIRYRYYGSHRSIRTQAFFRDRCHSYGIYWNTFNTQKFKLIYNNIYRFTRATRAPMTYFALPAYTRKCYGLFVCIEFCESCYHLSLGKPLYLKTFLFVKFALITDHTCKELQLQQSTCVIAQDARWTYTFLWKQCHCFWKVSFASITPHALM